MANTILGLTPLEGGLLLVRMTAGIPVGAIIGGLACQRTDSACRLSRDSPWPRLGFCS